MPKSEPRTLKLPPYVDFRNPIETHLNADVYRCTCGWSDCQTRKDGKRVHIPCQNCGGVAVRCNGTE